MELQKIAEYGIGTWNYEGWGNHRALVEVAEISPGQLAVCAQLPWRRRDKNVEQKGIFIRCQNNGKNITNIWSKQLNREQGEIVFEATFGAGIYEIYYMAYGGQTRASYPVINYLSVANFADSQWLAAVKKAQNFIPAAKLLRFEACDELHSFFPMEIIATKNELQQLCARYAVKDFLLFGESRARPIKMRQFLPAHWAWDGAFNPLQIEALRGEYLTFQVGVFAHREALHGLTAKCGLLYHPKEPTVTLPHGEATCLQLSGVDCTGETFHRRLELAAGEVQALWFGLPIAMEQAAGQYCGRVVVETAAGQMAELPLIITVSSQSIANYGDDEPQRLSRLRWLNSRRGSEALVTKPFTSVRRAGQRLDILGRSVQLGAHGLPQQIATYFTPELTSIGSQANFILDEPMKFCVRQNGQVLSWQEIKKHSLQFSEHSQAAISWQQKCTANNLLWSLNASLEFDGCLTARCDLLAPKTSELDDVYLQFILPPELVKYRLGLGYEGQESREPIAWKWDVANKNQDSLWLGRECAGLQIALRDANYRRPLNTNFYRLQPLLAPTWDNHGRGGINLQPLPSGNFCLTCYSGRQTLAAGQERSFIFRLLITPFKPFDAHKQWTTRFLHQCKPPILAKAEGANVINMHHGTPPNPYINYPFLRPQKMRDFVQEAHNLQLKVCIYYTVRELSNHAPEIFALRSLGTEIFTAAANDSSDDSNGDSNAGPGGKNGGGHSWLQEHFGCDYIPAWHVFAYDCVAVLTSASSRWHNFYVEGVNWLAKNIGIDGIYLDDLAFGRQIMQRLRRVLDAQRPGAILDMHSANQYNARDGFANSINLYMENLPYLDRLWFGEYFHYEKGPDYWMTEVAGLPFGVGGEMLEGGGNLWRGLLYGMTSRYPYPKSDPRPVWQLLQNFGIADSKMLGYWAPTCPVRSNSPRVLATCYQKSQTMLIVLASWEETNFAVQLSIDWTLWPQPQKCYQLWQPFMAGVQPQKTYQLTDKITLPPGGGTALILRPQ